MQFASWSKTPADQRQAALERFVDLLEENAEDFMALLTREQGKPRAGKDVDERFMAVEAEWVRGAVTAQAACTWRR